TYHLCVTALGLSAPHRAITIVPAPSYLMQGIRPAPRHRRRARLCSSISSMPQVHDLTVVELAAAIRAGELSPADVTDHYLRRTAEPNDQVGAFFTVCVELATEQAMAAEKAVAGASGPACLPPLAGVPVPVKDLTMVAGVRQTLGSAAHAADVPDADD